jgi:signal transduction histidine kinase
MIQTKRDMWKVIAQKNAAEQASREKTEFISIASHELRTPLYAISGFTELLEHSNLTDEQYAYVRAIKTASLTVKIITDNVLDFSRLENNVCPREYGLMIVCGDEGASSVCGCTRTCVDFCDWDCTAKHPYRITTMG